MIIFPIKNETSFRRGVFLVPQSIFTGTSDAFEPNPQHARNKTLTQEGLQQKYNKNTTTNSQVDIHQTIKRYRLHEIIPMEKTTTLMRTNEKKSLTTVSERLHCRVNSVSRSPRDAKE